MKNKPAKKFDPVIIIGYIVVVLIHLIGYLVTRTTPDMSPMEVNRMAMIKVVSGILGIISIVVIYIVTVVRTKKQYECPSCGTKAQSADGKKCDTCGASLVNS